MPSRDILLVVSDRQVAPQIERISGLRAITTQRLVAPMDDYPLVLLDLSYLNHRGLVEAVRQWHAERPHTHFLYLVMNRYPEAEVRLIGALMHTIPGQILTASDLTQSAAWPMLASGGPPVWQDLLCRLQQAAPAPIAAERAVGELLKNAPNTRSLESAKSAAYQRLYRTLRTAQQRPPKELVRGFRIGWAVALHERGVSPERIALLLNHPSVEDYRARIGASFNLTKRDLDRLTLARVTAVFAAALLRTTDGVHHYPRHLPTLPEVGALLLRGS